MMVFILVIHSIVCVLLILAVLMQSGRGGGLTEQFASAESVFGAQTSSFMVRVTSVLATIFFITCMTLAFLSAGKETSLMADRPGKKINKLADINIPKEPVEEAAQPVNDAVATVQGVLPVAQETAKDVMAEMPAAADVSTPVVADVQK